MISGLSKKEEFIFLLIFRSRPVTWLVQSPFSCFPWNPRLSPLTWARQYHFRSLCGRAQVELNALAFIHPEKPWKRGALTFAKLCLFGSKGYFIGITKVWFVGEDSEIKMLGLLRPNNVGPVLQGRGVRETLLMTAKTEYGKTVTWNQCISPLGLLLEKLMSHQFHRAVQWEFQACCSSRQVNGEISQCMGASPVLKNTKDSSLVPQWMRRILYSVSGGIPGHLDFQGGFLDLLCSAGPGFSALNCPCGVQLSQLLCVQLEPIWQNQKDPCDLKLPMITLCLILFVSKWHTLICIHYTRFTPKEDVTQNNLCEVWQVVRLKLP